MEENKNIENNILSDEELDGVAGGVSMGVPLVAQQAVLRGTPSGSMTTAELRQPVKKKKNKKMPKGSIQSSITEHQDSGFRMV